MKARYKAVVDRYAQAIRSGQLPAGSRLPTHRTLAAGERISLATATRVYRELEEMGLVSGETGRLRETMVLKVKAMVGSKRRATRSCQKP